jgi:general secretion pathway protein C
MVEVGLVLLLALQGARLVWAAVTPVGPLGTPVLATARPVAPPTGPDLAVLERFNPFFRGQTVVVGAVAAAPVDAAQLGLKLHGVRGAMFGDRGSAIIATPDGKQGSYGVGETIMPGIVLRAVGGDHVVLSQNGADLRLPFAEFAAAPPPAGPAPVPTPGQETPPAGLRLPPPPASAPAGAIPPPSASIDPARFLAQAGLQQRPQGGGYVLNARGRGDMLRQAGLQPGDVLLAVNGSALSGPEQLGEMATELRNAPEAEIRFERGGQVMTTRVRTGR